MAQPQMLNSFLKDLGLNLGGGGGGNKKQKVSTDWRGRPIKPIPPNPYNASVQVAPGPGGASEAARISKYLQDASDRGWAAAHGGRGADGWRGGTTDKKKEKPKRRRVVPKKKAPQPEAPKIEITQEDGFGIIPPHHAAPTDWRKPLAGLRSGTGV